MGSAEIDMERLARFGAAAKAAKGLGDLDSLLKDALESGVKGADKVVSARIAYVRAMGARAALAARGQK